MNEREESSLDSDEKGIVLLWDKVTAVLLKISWIELVNSIWKKHIGYDRCIYEGIIDKIKKSEKLSPDEKKEYDSMEKLYYFIDIAVAIQPYMAFIIAILLFYFAKTSDKFCLFVLEIYIILRVLEIMVKQVRIILFDTVGKNSVSIKGARRSIILLFHNVAEMIFWFGCSYMIICLLSPGYLSEMHILNHLCEGDFTFQDYIQSSSLLFIIGGGSNNLLNSVSSYPLLNNITFIEVIVGFLIILFSFGRLISLLPNIRMHEEA